MCKECYADDPRATPLLHPQDCLTHHTQYRCGTCGRCICIERDPKRGVQRWNFPFQSAQIARLYLRAADETMKSSCGVYELIGKNGRRAYKIFASDDELNAYLAKNPDKSCPQREPVYTAGAYREYPHTQVRRLTEEEALQYLREQANK